MGKKRRRLKKTQKSTNRPARDIVSQSGKRLSKQPTSNLRWLAVSLVIVCAVVTAVHWPALSAKAISIDDDQYLIDNLLVQNPSLASARRFLTEVLEPSTVRGYYQPLAMISLMCDYAIGGRPDNLRPFHRTSLALHTANTALVIVLLYLLFGQPLIAAAVGLLFGVHPMTVEPIPWVGERKTLLAAFFALWCLVLYVRFARKGSWRVYLGCLVMYVLALMSKPTSTPLPILMLLMDYWPLKRLNRRTLLEKLPFFAVGGIFAIITYISQSRTSLAKLPGAYSMQRIVLVLCHNVIFYLYKIIWPTNLSSHYAFPEPLGLSEPMVLAGVIGSCVLVVLLVISLRWTPAALTGWLFFFAAILPTMQIIGFSNVIASDKFAYLPSIGLLMALCSFLGWFCGKAKPVSRAVATATVILILSSAETLATRRYLAHWRDSVSLYQHMLTVTPGAALLHYNLGVTVQSQGRLNEAANYYRKALQLEPYYHETHNNLGTVLQSQGKLSEAISHYRQALKAEPSYAEAHNNLGAALEREGKLHEAVSHFRKALHIKPDYAEAHSNLAVALALQGNLDEAVGHFRQALRISPNDVEAHYNLGRALQSQGKLDEAIMEYRQALKIDPGHRKASENLKAAMTGQQNR